MIKVLVTIFVMLFVSVSVYADKYDKLVYGATEYKYPDNSSYGENSVTVNSNEYRLLSNNKITIGFSDGRVFGSSGVNRFMGSYELKGDKIEIRLGSSTMMMGSEKEMEQERELLMWLEGSHSVRLLKDRLFLDGIEFEQVKSNK